MRQRMVELLLVVGVVALVSWQLWKPSVQSEAASGYQEGGPPLAFNGVHVGDKISDLEARLGPPDFKNAEVRYQQWEQPLTQLSFNDQGVVVGVGGSGSGVLSQGNVSLLRCGYSQEKDVLSVFGSPPARPKEHLYRYPGLTWDNQGSATDLEVHCGSESNGVYDVSHIQLGQNGGKR